MRAIRSARGWGFVFLVFFLLFPGVRLSAQRPSYLFVSSWGTHKIQRFEGVSGEFTDTFAASEDLLLPLGLAFGTNRNPSLFVVSPGTHSVLRYDGQTGEYLGVFAQSEELVNPQDLVFGPHDGHLYVSSFDTHSVVRFNGLTGASMGVFCTLPGLTPRAVAFSPHDGDLYVSSAFSNQVFIFKRDTGFLDQARDEFASAGDLVDPISMQFSPGDGHLYVTSFHSHEVKRYHGVTGAFIDNFVGAESGGLTNPNGLRFGPDGDLYVASFGTHEIKRYHGGTGEFVEDFTKRNALCAPTALIFRPLPPLKRGFEQMEATLAEGSARFTWWNPSEYSEIQVTDAAGMLLAELPGDATAFEWPTSESELPLTFRATTMGNETVASVGACAIKLPCARPPPLVGTGIAHPKVEFTVNGGDALFFGARCADGAGGGLEVDVAGAGLEPVFGGNDLELGAGFVVTDNLAALLPERFIFSTGFRLTRDADTLEIRARYNQLATVAGLSLRCRLARVFPKDGVPGRFTDEFSFPPIVISSQKDWYAVTYYRADRDVTAPANPPNDPGPIRCGLPIPAGEYKLDLYAVGGMREVPYFSLGAEAATSEILIPEVPCPPYPQVEVRDLTGIGSPPTVTSITGRIAEPCQGILGLFKPVGVVFTAFGNWVDEEGVVWRNDPDDSVCNGCEPDCPLYKDNPNFEYKWKIFDADPPTVVCSGAKNSVYVCLKDVGCYKVEVTVTDRRCGIRRKAIQEVAVVPDEVPSTAEPNQFLFPKPDPNDIYAIVGLTNPTPGEGRFHGERPLDVRVLVAPKCFRDGSTPPSQCFAAETNDVEFRLAVRFFTGEGLQFSALDAIIDVLDLCPNVTTGAKYYALSVADLGTIASHERLDGFTAKSVVIQGRTVQQNGTEISLPSPSMWQDIASLNMMNAPEALSQAYWTGSFEESESAYHFEVRSAGNGPLSASFGPSQPLPFNLPGLNLGLPSYETNTSASEFIARFSMSRGTWRAETGAGTTSGELLGNSLSSAPVLVEPIETGGGAGEGGGAIVTPPSYSWAEQSEIFNQQFSQDLFDSILYTGFVGPVPVTVRAAIGLSLGIRLTAHVCTSIDPFTAGSVSNRFGLESQVKLSIPAKIRADILFGVASVSASLIPQASFDMKTLAETTNLSAPSPSKYARAVVKLFFEVKACISFIFDDICYSKRNKIAERTIFEVGSNLSAQCPGAGAGLDEADVAGGQGGGLDVGFFVETSAPATAITPDGLTVLDAFVEETGIARGFVRPLGFEGGIPLDFGPGLIDPAAVFVSQTLALVAWTRNATSLNPAVPGQPTLAEINLAARDQDIVLFPVRNQGAGAWMLGAELQASDIPAEVAAASRRADGTCALAADRPGEAALLAWVRYVEDVMVLDQEQPLKSIILPADEADPPCGAGQEYCERTVANNRPQLEKTAIFVRWLDAAGLPGPAFSISPAGINIEPAVAVAPVGDTACAVWVHDSTPGHRNLLDSNRGRRLFLARGSRVAGAWYGPFDVVALPDNFPGILEPSVAMRSPTEGMVAFTALRPGAAFDDTGLGGGNRVVYVVHWDSMSPTGPINFSAPVLIRGRCLEPVYGHWVELHVDLSLSEKVAPLNPAVIVSQPGDVLTFMEFGVPGSRAGSGNIRASVLSASGLWSPALNLTPDDEIHYNVASVAAGGAIHAMHLNGGPAAFLPGAGGGAGVEIPPAFEAVDVALDPDPAIVSCRLSDPFSGPGAQVAARVTVENQGLASTHFTRGRLGLPSSALRVGAVYTGDDGEERVVADAAVPILEPGEIAEVLLDLEMPHDPVDLRVELFMFDRFGLSTREFLDGDPTNNFRRCFLGAPRPLGFECRSVAAGDENQTLLVELAWSNPAVYEEIQIYRDGSMFAAVPGSCTRFLDQYAAPGEHTYWLRGCIDRSKSARAVCSIQHEAPAQGVFLRGDTNSDGTVDISDGIFGLAFLFLGGQTPVCERALDANDDSEPDISDMIYVLSYLFLARSPEPPPPFPGCGLDLTPDSLPCATQSRCR